MGPGYVWTKMMNKNLIQSTESFVPTIDNILWVANNEERHSKLNKVHSHVKEMNVL